MKFDESLPDNAFPLLTAPPKEYVATFEALHELDAVLLGQDAHSLKQPLEQERNQLFEPFTTGAQQTIHAVSMSSILNTLDVGISMYRHASRITKVINSMAFRLSATRLVGGRVAIENDTRLVNQNVVLTYRRVPRDHLVQYWGILPRSFISEVCKAERYPSYDRQYTPILRSYARRVIDFAVRCKESRNTEGSS